MNQLALRILYFEDLSVGMTETLSKTIAASDVVGFAQLTGDRNPIHLSEHFAAKTRFGKRIAHGLYTASLISAVLGTRLPGPGAVYISQTLNFRAGKADYIERYADDFKAPYGLAYRDGFVLIADQEGIWRVPHVSGALRAGRPDQPKITDVAPEQRKPVPAAYGQELITQRGVFGVVAGHQNRHLAIDPKTGAMFVGVGSSGNIGVEPEVKASIQRFEPDGSGQTTFASGMRNPTTLAFHPTTGELYAGVQERDGLGDNLPPDYLTRVEKGAFFGWPYAYTGSNPQPGFAHLAPEKVKATIIPDVLFQPHSSVLDMVFYDGEQFPAEYRGDAFVALKGSWNRSEPTGYKVVRVRFKDGRPEGSYENFVTGFWVSGQHRAEVWGRPAALAVMKDGSLLIGDDTGGDDLARVLHRTKGTGIG